MTFEVVAPDCWPRFVRVVNSMAPAFPLGRETPSQAAMRQGTEAVGMGQTAVELAGGTVHPAIGVATGLAGSGSGSDVANVAGDTATGWAVGSFLEGVPGANVLGLIVGNGINVLRGSIEAIMRSDEVDDYLQQFFGYKTTLARAAIETVNRGLPYASMPRTLIPDYLNDRFHVPRHRGSFRRGAMRVNSVIREMDSLRPMQGNQYSALCFTHLFLAGAGVVTSREGRRDFRTRERIQRYVDTQLLRRSLERDRMRLIRYANSGR